MIGSVSCTIQGVSCVLTLDDDRIWNIDRAGELSDMMIDNLMTLLDDVAERDVGPAMGTYGPPQLAKAAELLRGTAYLEPKTPPPDGVIH